MSPVDQAVRLLLAGELVAIPTETVYGLGADAANPAAVAKIFAAKGRPADHPLIVHLSGDELLDAWARDIPDVAWELAEQFWPGPLTLILKKHPDVPLAVTGGQDTVGVRVPGHPLALELLRAFRAAGGSGGVAAPSANRFGRISPTTAQHVRDDLGDAVPLILDGGDCQVGIESTIIDLSRAEPVILRPGMIAPEALALVLGHCPALGAADAGAPRVSGALEAHYAPRTPLLVLDASALAAQVASALAVDRTACGLAVLSRSCPDGFPPERWIAAAADARTYGCQLYAHLRTLDRMGATTLLIEATPDDPAWTAITDRLRRAQVGSSVSPPPVADPR